MTQQAQVQTGAKKKRAGLIHARIGATFNVELKGGRTVSLTVKDRSRCKSDKIEVRCLTCGKKATSPEELYEAHDEQAVMQKRAQTHVWAYFVEAGLKDFNSSAPDDFGRTQREIAAANRAYALSDAGLFADAVLE
jgi:hypothetical protein